MIDEKIYSEAMQKMKSLKRRIALLGTRFPKEIKKDMDELQNLINEVFSDLYSAAHEGHLPPTVEEYPSGSDTLYVIQGHTSVCDEVIDRIMRDYDHQGYGTRVTKDTLDGEMRTVVVSRWNSCD